MKNVYFLISFIVLSFGVNAQNRYLDEMFPVKVTKDQVYGKNISILTGTPMQIDLLMDIYEPDGDTKTDRPIVLIAHTGSFLPQILNQQVTGSRSDSTVVETARRLASRGFVVAAYTYRLGWVPGAPDQDVRTSTLLQAAYRAIQDTRTCIRYFKKTAAEDNNPHGIDPNKICVWGIGTGGYLAMGAGSVNDFGEVTLDKFISQTTAKPYIDSTIYGNIWGTSQAAICIPNYPNYSSNFQLSVNLGGALGDSTWMDGEDIEPAYTGVHCVNDFFAPYYHGAVIVPTTNQFVIYATGTRKAMEQANLLGSNDVLNTLDPKNDPLSTLINAQKNTPTVIPLTQQRINLGTDNFYGFNIPLIFNNQPVPQGSPWEWWDLNTLRVIVPIVNQRFGTSINADSLHLTSLRTNPDMSAAKARAYIDTTIALAIPRACMAMGLGCNFVDVTDVNPDQVNLHISPNPAKELMHFTTNSANPITSIYIYDLNGKLVKAHADLNTSTFAMPRNAILAGMYIAQIHMGSIVTSQQIIFKD